MGTKSPGGPQRCRIILQHCLAIQLCKPGHTPEDFWMYDSGYMIFQNFLAANSQCWWNAPLTAATRALRYAGHIAPGMLLVTAEPCALEVLRGAYARSVLKPPATYVIQSLGDIDDCIVTPTPQGQFTPLTEALCDVIMDLTATGQSATIENIKVKLSIRFPHMQQPTVEMIYDTLAQIMQEGKIYQTSKGYFIVTPERRRSRSRPRNNRSYDDGYNHESANEPQELKTILMSNSEALHSLYGEISTERDGDLTHQCIQTNLADVICGGNPNDKILYPRNAKRRSASFPTPRSLERRHSLRLFGSSKRLQRCASTRSLSKNYAQTLLGTDSSSSEYQSTDSSSPKKGSLLSRLFRRSGRTKQRQLETYSAQFPPAEWFNSRAVHLHSVGTQTIDNEIPAVHTLSNSTFYDGSEISQRSSTLPRRHHRRHLSSESTFLISSRDCSPIRRRSPAYCNDSPYRSTHSISSANQKLKMIHNKQIIERENERNRMTASVETFRGSPTRNGILDNKILNEREKFYRNVQSGPSSLESGKASIITSGPSSIDSGKMSYSRTSGHSSLESHCSTNTVQSPNRLIAAVHPSPAANSSPKRQSQSTKAKLGSDYSFNKTNNNNSPPPKITTSSPSRVSHSNSNSSITLQVTTNSSSSQNNIPSTKIYVQNSPVRSVITLENGKLTENSNVFIINNETTTNSNGDIIKRNISKQNSTPSKGSKREYDKENYFSENEAEASETCDSLSMLSEISPDSNLVTPVTTNNDTQDVEASKFTKNINNDATMNNSRKLSLHIANNQKDSNIIYNNVLKNDSNPTSPINNKNIYNFDVNNTNSYDQLAGSVGNLRCYDKNIIGSQNKVASNCDLKSLQVENSKLNSNPTINTDSLAHILHKGIVAVGSEPNLAIKNIPDPKITDKPTVVENSPASTRDQRRYSLSKDQNLVKGTTPSHPGTGEVYSFPSLTDLSFNFTSLAAQKILQGVSINSIDTLVELNMANNTQEKQQNNTVGTICTDYGMV